MKCTKCNNDECKGYCDYTNQLSKVSNYVGIDKISDESLKKAGVLSAGLGTIAAGATVTTLTSGLFPFVLGSMLTGAGYSLMIVPLMKFYTGEPLTKEEIGKDIAIGAAIGAVTGPIGYGASELTKGASSGISKFGIRTLFSSGAGAASRVVLEGARYVQGGAVSVGSFAKSVGQGAFVGSIGGVSAHMVSGSAGVVRVVAQGTTAAATDAGIQYHEKGNVDLKQTAMTAVGQLTVATTSEVASTIAQKSPLYANKINNEMINKDVKSEKISKEEGVKIKAIIKEANENIPSDLKTQKRFGESRIHKLFDRSNSKRADQIAFDTNGKDSAARGLAEKVNGKYVFLDKTSDHNYKECRDTWKGKLPNPIEGLKATKIASYFTNKSEQNDNEKLKGDNSYRQYATYIFNYFKKHGRLK